MSSVRHRQWRGVPVLSLVGEVGREAAEGLSRALVEARGESRGRVVLDLRRAVHLHYRVATLLAAAAHDGSRLHLVGPTPYVRQILRLAGALEADAPEHGSLGEAWRAAGA